MPFLGVQVPDGQARFVTTRQMAPNEKGFVGYETVWKPFQKVADVDAPLSTLNRCSIWNRARSFAAFQSESIATVYRTVRLFEEAITPRTRVLAMSHVLYSTGTVLPVREICELARSRNLVSIRLLQQLGYAYLSPEEVYAERRAKRRAPSRTPAGWSSSCPSTAPLRCSKTDDAEPGTGR